MCGYACVGCGKCGKPKTLTSTLTCLKCGTPNEVGAATCSACGYSFAPGVPGRRQEEERQEDLINNDADKSK